MPSVIRASDDAHKPSWVFVIGQSFIVGVGEPAPEGVVSRLLALVDDPDATIERIVGVIPLAGEDAVESFGLVSFPAPGEADGSDRRITAIVRGTAAIDIHSPGGSRRFDDRGIRPWHLADFTAVTGLALASRHEPLDAHAPGRAVDLRSRRIRATRLEWLREGAESADTEQTDAAIVARTLPRPVGVPWFKAGDVLYSLDGTALIGRRPRRRAEDGDDVVALITLESPASTVSGTHLELRRHGSRIVATDLSSTNGTIAAIGGTRRPLVPGEPQTLGVGATLDLGDGAIVEILPVDADPAGGPSEKKA
ncbi:FHA domain-containing protein [Agromyces atrinae]|uniref:FHA domain-containing protein n=1 Tax=Agromyces atrinae TaxID=592376 RepID=A0A4Q2M1F0_9MICO|nr:FHA domain-containing protein [Agromyces atrinae]NYD65756.1 hypothetical protein [Agromyces atrinae]RXZ85548.1 FHA domain-containing protein [Agromyces atrinae]